MKHVAILGADFAPSSLPPAQRIRLFARHLPEYGWQPIIITTDPKHYEWPVDAENQQLIPDDLEVIRTPAMPARFSRKIGVGDIGIRSMWHHWRVIANLCCTRQIDALVIPVPPYVPMILGRFAHMRFRIPYVIDYIDPWVTGYYWKLPSKQRPPKWPLAYTLSRVLEPFALRHVAHVVGVSHGTTDSVVSRHIWLKPEDATEIPYGGEPSDLDYLRAHPRSLDGLSFDPGLLHVSYVGACIPAMQPTVRALLKAVKLGLQKDPALFSRIRMHFVGTTYNPKGHDLYAVAPIAKELGIADYVLERPTRVDYLDSLQILLNSHALVAVGSDAPHYTASKIFPYVMSRKPLLAIFHKDSSVVKILSEADAGQTVTFDSTRSPEEKVEEIYLHIRNMLLLPEGHQPPTRWDVFEQYSARTMSGRLARVLDRAIVSEASGNTEVSREQEIISASVSLK